MSQIQPAIEAEFSRLPPSSVESEMCLLGSMMLSPDMLDLMSVEVDRDEFYSEDNRIIFDTVCEMHRAGAHVDGMTLRVELDKRGQLADVGGPEYIYQLLNAVPSAAHAETYAAEVARTAALRRMISVSNDVLRRCYSPSKFSDSVEEIAATLKDAADLAVCGGKDTAVRIGDAVMESMMAKEKGEPPAIATGLSELDKLIYGFTPGTTTIIGSRPSMGKSQLAKQFALNIARTGRRVLIIAVEENRRKVADNILSNVSGVFNNKVRHNDLTSENWTAMADATKELDGLPIWIDDAPVRLDAIEAAITRRVARDHVDVVLVDYLQLIDVKVGRNDNRENAVRAISNGLKRIFKTKNLAGVVMAQLNRAGGAAERPTMEHLKESGSIEQDGDVILLLYREDYARRSDATYIQNHVMEIIVAKSKDGVCGTAMVRFDGAFQRVSDFPEGWVHAHP